MSVPHSAAGGGAPKPEEADSDETARIAAPKSRTAEHGDGPPRVGQDVAAQDPQRPAPPERAASMYGSVLTRSTSARVTRAKPGVRPTPTAIAT